MTRAKILEKAKDIVNGQRDEMYGSPENSFSAIAVLWESYFAARDIANVVTPDSDFFVGRISEYDVAMLMILLKIARSMKNPDNPDHYIDMAGYAACVGEIYTQPFAEQDAEECVTDEEIEIGDEVYSHGVRGVVTRLYSVGSDSEDFCGILYQNGNFSSSALKNLKKTGRHFQGVVEILKKMNEE